MHFNTSCVTAFMHLIILLSIVNAKCPLQFHGAGLVAAKEEVAMDPDEDDKFITVSTVHYFLFAYSILASDM